MSLSSHGLYLLRLAATNEHVVTLHTRDHAIYELTDHRPSLVRLAPMGAQYPGVPGIPDRVVWQVTRAGLDLYRSNLSDGQRGVERPGLPVRSEDQPH
jgi:hypothetical protein